MGQHQFARARRDPGFGAGQRQAVDAAKILDEGEAGLGIGVGGKGKSRRRKYGDCKQMNEVVGFHAGSLLATKRL